MVGMGDAQFQPMYVTLETFEASAREFLRSSPSRAFQPSAVNFLPGPVTVRREVKRAFEQAPESHRAEAFVKDFASTKQALCSLVNAKSVELFLGSGTLANDVVAGQLSLEGGRGLILSNGEFGERLIDQARRFGLAFDSLEVDWGQALDLAAIRAMLERNPVPAWLWCAHCETSTGVMADLERLKVLCSEFQVKLCLDCISSIGTMAIDLEGVYLASGSSGKGLRSYPGVSMVFITTKSNPPLVCRGISIWVISPPSKAYRSPSPRIFSTRCMLPLSAFPGKSTLQNSKPPPHGCERRSRKWASRWSAPGRGPRPPSSPSRFRKP